MATEVQIRHGEPIDKALRRLKKKLDRENTIREVRMRRQYEKPSAINNRESKIVRKRIIRFNRIARRS